MPGLRLKVPNRRRLKRRQSLGLGRRRRHPSRCLTSHRPRGLRPFPLRRTLKMRGKGRKTRTKSLKWIPLQARSATCPRRRRHSLTSRANVRKRKRQMKPLQVMARLRTSKESNKSMSSSPIRMRNERRPKKNRRRVSWRVKVRVRTRTRTRMKMKMRACKQGRCQMKRKTMCPHPLKPTPLSSLCQGHARLQVLRRPKGP